MVENGNMLTVINCDLCGADSSWRIGWRGKFKSRIETVVCRRCGLIYERRRLSDGAAAQLYERGYYAEYAAVGDYDVPAEMQVAWRKTAQRRLDVLASVVPSLVGKAVLEIGCGAGFFLAAAKERGAEVVGVEPSKDVARFARDSLGITVHQGTLEKVRPLLSEHKFDVIALFHVLEHLPSPTSSLLDLYSLLAPSGIMFIEVPNAVHQIRLRQPVDGFLRPVHFYNFTWKSLRALMKRTGFDTLAEDGAVGHRCVIVATPSLVQRGVLPLSVGRCENSLSVVVFFGLWHAVTLVRRILTLLREGR
jgi:2-polyprenyl-3-methyl-5-hydroxy-6-metoxy-1,4-benzoquinol methylase